MRIIDNISDIRKTAKGQVLTIGNFDGVHLGHQKILRAGKQAIDKARSELAALTFDPHPVSVLQPEKKPGVLTPLALKRHLLGGCDVDNLIVLKSTPEILRLSAEDFVEQFLVEAIQPSAVIEGEDFNFGAARRGNIATLQNLGAEKGFKVTVVPAQEVKLSSGRSVRVSSTMIRKLLERGEVKDAAAALGRSYRLIGQVVPGHGKGKQLGFPTANLSLGTQIIPAEGVYAGTVEIAESQLEAIGSRRRVPAALSIGRARTLGEQRPQLVEAHLLVDNVGELTGKWMAMDFVRQLRSQIKFETEKELAEQIAKDCQQIRTILAAEQAEKAQRPSNDNI
ncbi:MAG: bifunctional riboflavin kinase/FAD synthetase [Planctomycetota bacterium]|jgi:riboflavin kinase/FMN adenylyltransferase